MGQVTAGGQRGTAGPGPGIAAALPIRVRQVTPANAAAWFAIAPAAPSPETVARFAEGLAGGPLDTVLRLVAEFGGRPFARCVAQRDEGDIRVWIPTFREPVAAFVRKAAMAEFIRMLLLVRAAVGLGHLPVETHPGDDLPGNGPWLEALHDAGFACTCAYRIYLHDAADEALRSTPGLSIREARADDLPVLAALHREVSTNTLVQRRDPARSAEDHIRDLAAIGDGFNAALWLIAEDAGVPVGYALANASQEAEFEGLSAWIVDIGSVPSRRRTGIGAMLLAALQPRLRAAGCRRALAAIDDINTPSIALHTRHGFRPLPHRHYVYRYGR